MPPVGFEPTISAGEQTKTYDLDRAATGIGIYKGAESHNLFISHLDSMHFVMTRKFLSLRVPLNASNFFTDASTFASQGFCTMRLVN